MTDHQSPGRTPDQDQPPTAGGVSRRHVLAGAMGLSGAALVGGCASAPHAHAAPKADSVNAQTGRFKQSIASWCFSQFGEEWSLDKQIQVAKQLGCDSIELVGHKDLPKLRKHGLTAAMVPNGMPAPPFKKGFNNPKWHPTLIKHTKEAIDAAAANDCPNVIVFTGYRYEDPDDPSSRVIPDDEGIATTIKGLKKVVGYAEKKGVTLCLENLNARVTDHPFKGHPGYQGAHVADCIDVVNGVGSDHMKMLFDIYHAQIMDGDLIRRVREHKDAIGHVHTAGNPGRGELGEGQEIRYRPIMQALADTGYTGYVCHEFIPTRDPLAGLREAVNICTV
jgi:hydroxypyruvate isomerase